MAFNIQTFKASLDNIARPTLFSLKLTSIPVMNNWPGDLLEFTCKGSQLPAFTTGKIQVPYMGRKVNFMGDVDYQDWNITVISDRQMNIWRALYAWRQMWNSSVGNISEKAGNIHTEYKANAELYMYSNSGGAVMAAEIIGLYPIDVPAVQLSWETTDSTLDVECTFMMDYFYLKNENPPTYLQRSNKESGNTTLGISHANKFREDGNAADETRHV